MCFECFASANQGCLVSSKTNPRPPHIESAFRGLIAESFTAERIFGPRPHNWIGRGQANQGQTMCGLHRGREPLSKVAGACP